MLKREVKSFPDQAAWLLSHCSNNLHSRPCAMQHLVCKADFLSSGQLFILDVAAKYKLPDVDVVITSAGETARGLC